LAKIGILSVTEGKKPNGKSRFEQEGLIVMAERRLHLAKQQSAVHGNLQLDFTMCMGNNAIVILTPSTDFK